MKKIYLTLAAAFMLTIGVNSQNLLADGDMELADGWMVSNLSNESQNTNDYEFGYYDDAPTNGADGCLHVTLTNAGGGTHVMFYQQVDLVAGKQYKFDFAAKTVSPNTMMNSWIEAYYGTVEPTDGADYGAVEGSVWALGGFKYSGWEGSCSDDFDGTLQVDGCLANSQNTISVTEDMTVYVGLKLGIWDATGGFTVELLLDNISLVEDGTTAINDVKEAEIKLYPVPASNYLNIESSNTFVSAQIVNLIGQTVKTVKTVNGQINVADLTAGIYTIELTDELGASSVLKFIKK